VTDGRTDGHRVLAIAALCIASHGKNLTIAKRSRVSSAHKVTTVSVKGGKFSMQRKYMGHRWWRPLPEG